MATANAATFDGSTTSLTRGTDFTSNPGDSKQWSFGLWVKRGTTGTLQDLYLIATAFNRLSFLADNKFRFAASNAAGTVIQRLDSSSALSDTASWHSVLGAANLANASQRHLYLDDVDVLTAPIYTDDTIDFTRNEHTFGSPNFFNGDLSIFWMNFGQYIDFSVESNRRAFVTSDLKVPRDLANSTNGDIGGFGQPILFLNTAVPNYENNLGFGGGLTENGTLVAATGPQISGTQILRRRREYVGIH